jgi:hypothetical protein
VTHHSPGRRKIEPWLNWSVGLPKSQKELEQRDLTQEVVQALKRGELRADLYFNQKKPYTS